MKRRIDIKNLYLGLGGTSTSDVGVGALFSLGAKFFLSNHEEVNNPSISDMLKVESIDLAALSKFNFNIFVVNDVTNPLIGKNKIIVSTLKTKLVMAQLAV